MDKNTIFEITTQYGGFRATKDAPIFFLSVEGLDGVDLETFVREFLRNSGGRFYGNRVPSRPVTISGVIHDMENLPAIRRMMMDTLSPTAKGKLSIDIGDGEIWELDFVPTRKPTFADGTETQQFTLNLLAPSPFLMSRREQTLDSRIITPVWMLPYTHDYITQFYISTVTNGGVLTANNLSNAPAPLRFFLGITDGWWGSTVTIRQTTDDGTMKSWTLTDIPQGGVSYIVETGGADTGGRLADDPNGALLNSLFTPRSDLSMCMEPGANRFDIETSPTTDAEHLQVLITCPAGTRYNI